MNAARPLQENTASGGLRVQTLFQEYGGFVHRVVRRLGVADRHVDDITQDVFVVALRGIDGFDGASPKAWLFQIARRLVSGHRRRHSTSKEVLSESDAAGEVVGQDESVWVREIRDALDEALQQLHVVEREIFLLHELEGLPMRETVQIVQCPIQTGYSRLNAARRKMRVALEGVAAAQERRR